MNTQENTESKYFTILRKLPEGWMHPSLNLDMSGYWGIYWGERLMFVERHIVDAEEILEQCNIEYEIID